MLTALKSSDSPSGRLMFQPDTENVTGRVDIAIMRRPAVGAFPVSHSKRTHTFRTAGRYRPAARARSGTISFVGFNKHGSVPSGLVAEHVSELRPTGVKNGLCKSRLGEASGVHIANNDQIILKNNLGRLLVKVMAAGISDLRMNGPRSFLISRSLSDCQFGFILAVMAKVGDLGPIAHGGKRGKAEINSDCCIAGGEIILHLALEHYIPVATCVLHKLARSIFPFNLTAFPEGVSTLEIDSAVAVDFSGAGDEWHPPKRPARAEAGAKARASAGLVAGLDELSTYLRDSIGMQSKVRRHALGQAIKVEGGRPSDATITMPTTLGFPLRVDAEIPNLITGNCMTAEEPISALDAILEADDAQSGSVLLNSGLIKSASSDCRSVARSLFLSFIAAESKGYLTARPSTEGR